MGDYVNVKELFGCDVFNDSVMQDRLPKKVYKELKKTIEDGAELDPSIADGGCRCGCPRDEGMGHREGCHSL